MEIPDGRYWIVGASAAGVRRAQSCELCGRPREERREFDMYFGQLIPLTVVNRTH